MTDMTYAIARRIAKEAEAHQISPHTWTPEIRASTKAAFFQLYMADDKEDRRLARILNREINLMGADLGRTANIDQRTGK